MRTPRRLAPLIALAAAALLLVACGADDPDGGGPDSPGTPSEPSEPTVPGGNDEPGELEPEIVVPRAGMHDVQPISFEDVEQIGESELRVYFWSGVEPCSVLDSVDVVETDEQVTITLLQGYEEVDGEPPVCIMLAVYKAVDVTLDAPLGDREVIDGAAR